MRIGLRSENKKISFEIEKCNLLEMFRGLMFRRKENAPALLLFDFKKPGRMKIHSWFVFFPFLAVWLDDKNKILEIKKVRSWSFCVFPKEKFYKLVEIPINKKYKKIVNSLCFKFLHQG